MSLALCCAVSLQSFCSHSLHNIPLNLKEPYNPCVLDTGLDFVYAVCFTLIAMGTYYPTCLLVRSSEVAFRGIAIHVVRDVRLFIQSAPFHHGFPVTVASNTKVPLYQRSIALCCASGRDFNAELHVL